MKQINKQNRGKGVLLCMLLLAFSLLKVQESKGQLPDCVSGNVAYAIFSDSSGSGFTGTIDSMEIRSVNLLTGAVGGLMGNRRYWIRKYSSGSAGNNNSYVYSASALAVDFASSKFFVMTQMGSIAIAKDIIVIDPLLGTTTNAGTTPSSLDGYHFVKMTAHPTNGYIYAIGVHRDSSTAANLVNPLIRFPACVTGGCATGNVQILGYLQNTPITYKWKLFNGDISFDNSGNLYFATAAYDSIGTTMRYSDARLFMINNTNLPTTSGSGAIPMTLLADYNGLDSTVINGIALNSSGTLFFTTRRYNGSQNPPLPTFNSELYKSDFPGTSSVLSGFVRPTAGTSVSDLATCYFPSAILADYKLQLSGKSVKGKNTLNWAVQSNSQIEYFEIQRSTDGVGFQQIKRVNKINSGTEKQRYTGADEVGQSATAYFYRVMQVLKNGTRIYSNIINLSGAGISFTKKISPNPFSNQFDIEFNLRMPTEVLVRLVDQNGRTIFKKTHAGIQGLNTIKYTGLGSIQQGVYFLELAIGDEIIREKLIKQ